MNNFKELQKIQEEQYRLNLDKIQGKMDSNIGFIGVFTQIIDIYLSKVIDCFINIAGGNSTPADDQK